MAKTCITAETARRQEWIENGLLELMLTTKYEDITVTDLCRHLPLARRSFYRYFRDMDDVLDSLLTHVFQGLALSDHILSMEEMLSGYQFWYQRRDLLDALRRSGLTDKLYEYALRCIDLNAIGPHLAPTGLGIDICREASLFVISGFVSLVIAWHADGFQKTPEQMAQIAYRMLFCPILEKKRPLPPVTKTGGFFCEQVAHLCHDCALCFASTLFIIKVSKYAYAAQNAKEN